MRRIPQRLTPNRVSHERWLVSYADFMTLLFAFFATLYGISSVDAQKLSTVAHALQAAFDDAPRVPPDDTTQSVSRTSDTALEAPARSSDDVRDRVSRDLAKELAAERLELIVDRRGVILSIPEAGTFGVGSDELSGTASQLVARVAQTLSSFSNSVRVEGHTDDVPIHNLRFASNWDLSASRASRVVELLISRGLPADRLSATGYAEFHPRVPNISAHSRASNRRIDLVILNAVTATAEEPRPAATAP